MRQLHYFILYFMKYILKDKLHKTQQMLQEIKQHMITGDKTAQVMTPTVQPRGELHPLKSLDFDEFGLRIAL